MAAMAGSLKQARNETFDRPQAQGGHMRRMAVAIALCVGVLVVSGVTFAAKSVNAQPRDCNIAKSFGTFKAVTAESWLLFEDETGTLRAVDYGCRVQRVINRQ
jgi:hypothetical protein